MCYKIGIQLEKQYERILNKYDTSSKMRLGLFVLLLIIFFINIYILNVHTTFVADDYNFHLVAQSIHSPQDYFAVLYQRYFGWTGRMLNEFLTYLFLSIDKKFFNVINALGYISLMLLIYFNIVGRKKIYLSLLVFINLFLFTFLPAFGQDILWIDGSVNYLWPTLVALSYTLLWRCYTPKKIKLYTNPLFLMFCIILGFFAGVTNENTSIAIFFMSIVFIICYKKWYNKIYVFSIFATVSELLGSLFLLLAPGNFVRAEIGGHVSFFKNFYKTFGDVFDPECLLIPLLLFLILYFLLKKANKEIACIFAFTSIIAVFSLSASPTHFFGRVVLSGLAFMMIAVGILYTQIDFKNPKIKYVICLLSIFFMLGNIKLYNSARADIMSYEDDYNINLQIIAQEKAAGNKNVIVNNISSKSRFCASYELKEIGPDPNHWVNGPAAKYFGIDTVKTIYIVPSIQN